jgi:hypothetical protein
MKISLDTKEDSTEDIHKVVKMLQAWLEGHHSSNSHVDIFGNSSQPQSSQASPASVPSSSEDSFFNMFADSGSSPSSISSADRESSIIDLKKDKDDEIPEIIPY